MRPFDRRSSLAALREQTFDVVVVGGGITGAGVVLDAASRGMSAALIEARDFASGTSSKSSKLAHGGLRYLQQGEVGLVYEALHERRRLLQNAPHLVQVLPFLIPMFGKGGTIPAKISRLLGAAMWGYDLTGGWRIGKFHERLTHDEALSYVPTLPRDRLVSAYLYYDATVDDARLVLTVLRTAALDHGAVVANRLPAQALSKSSRGRIDGVVVRDPDTSEEFTIRCRAVVNASGVWSDDVRQLDEGVPPDTIRPAKGIHIAVPWHLVRNQIAAVVPVRGDRRSVFVVPRGQLTYIGTTDTDYDGPLDDPQCTPEDIQYLLDAVNNSCTNVITSADVTGTWAGLRPLVKSASSGRTADLSRHHRVSTSDSGLVTITGGKLTTYRRMAADTVDEVIESVLAADTGFAGHSKSVTAKLPLRGKVGFDTLAEAAQNYSEVDPSIVKHLGSRFGGEARAVFQLIQSDPALGEPLVAGLPYVRAEVIHAVRHEMANTVDDVLSRRTRARIYGRDDSLRAVPDVGQLMGTEAGWTPELREECEREYERSVEAERSAAGLPHTALADLL